MTPDSPAPKRRGKASEQRLSDKRAAKAHQAAETARLAGTPLNVLVTAVQRRAQRGFKHEGASEPMGAFRTMLVKVITRFLVKRHLPALWIACIENAQGWGDHLHVALHIPTDRHGDLLPKLEKAIRQAFDWNMDEIKRENRERNWRGHDHLMFNPVKVSAAVEQFPEGEGFIDYLVKGAFELHGSFACTPLTISHELKSLTSQKAAQVAHITNDQLHRTYAQEACKGRRMAAAEAVKPMLAGMWARAEERRVAQVLGLCLVAAGNRSGRTLHGPPQRQVADGARPTVMRRGGPQGPRRSLSAGLSLPGWSAAAAVASPAGSDAAYRPSSREISPARWGSSPAALTAGRRGH